MPRNSVTKLYYDSRTLRFCQDFSSKNWKIDIFPAAGYPLRIEKTITALNGMVKDGIIEKYAIGGAMAAIFYTEPVPTYDLDVFVVVAGPRRALITLEPIYAYLRSRGHAPSQEHILIEGVPVQFIPVYNPLVEEAVENAQSKTYGSQLTNVLKPEYLIAIMLQTGRKKDKLRLAQFLEEISIDSNSLQDILARHNLTEKWTQASEGFDD